MSNRKARSPANNENMCPHTGKRLASSTEKPRKLLKLETASPLAAALSADLLQDMGIGMLDSEDSGSSSVASVIALAISAVTDENSNEGKPTFNVYCHQLMIYCPTDVDTGLDSSGGSASVSTQDPNETLKAVAGNTTTSDNAAKKFPFFDVSYSRSQEQLPHRAQHKAVSVLVGSAVTNSPSGNALQSGTSTSSTRSPLATVVCNSHNRYTASKVSPIPHQAQPALPQTSVVSDGAVTQNTVGSPSMPSTSRQAAAAMQQRQKSMDQLSQKQKLKQHLKQRQFQSTARKATPSDAAHTGKNAVESFFLFRHKSATNGCDYINRLSDEIILQIFKWLPKKTLLNCSYVCRRFNRCASDESLWTRLDMGGRVVRSGAMGCILPRGVVILRLAQAQLVHPVFDENFLKNEALYASKLQYLDLSMVTTTKPSLKMMLARCRHLRKLSLEHVSINDDICGEIASNTNLEALNLAMCSGLEAWSVRKLMVSLSSLTSLNISWTNLSVDAVTSLVTNVTPNLMRLNVAGCRKTMFDSHVTSLVSRCPNLLELDLSDCTGLTGGAISIICKFKMLEYLSLSRCYLIPAATYMDLIHMPTLHFLDVFGMLSDSALGVLELSFHSLGINKFIHSSVARPTVGSRRTSIWGLRTRD